MQPSQGFFVFVKYKTENVTELLSFLKTKWDKFVGTHISFMYKFIDENIKNWYMTEQRIGKTFRYFTGLTVFIACLGLFGLASFTAEQRTKEIGTRKVLGASVPGIVIMLSKQFTKWVLLANAIAWPVAYFFVDRWLKNFAYRIQIDIMTFFLSGILVLAIALITISCQSIRAATTNPVNSLRYE